MRKKLSFLLSGLLFCLLFSQLSIAQNLVCGFDGIQQQALKNATGKERILAADAAIQNRLRTKMNIQNPLAVTRSVATNFLPGANLVSTPSGMAYEVPVVVHVIHKGGAPGSADNPTDQQVSSAIDLLNKFYSATASGYPTVSQGGIFIPIQYVLAKRDPNCNATNGINHIDGSVLAGYADYGIKYGAVTNGAADTDVKNLSRWPTGSYYNIWFVHKITSSIGGVVGYADYPGTTSVYNGTVLDVDYRNSTHLAHELGHAMGLMHTFEGSNGTTCAAPETDCSVQGDKVCDTEQGVAWPSCTAGAINPCTGVAYAGGQYNIMNYGSCLNRFTAGQGDRALAGLETQRTSLLYSSGLKAPETMGALKPMTPPPAILNPNNAYNAGPTNVVLNDLVYSSSGYLGDGKIDYLQNLCLVKASIPASGATLNVTTWANRQYVKAWIDFNNNGSFENSELILDNRAPQILTHPMDYTMSAPITKEMLVGAVTNSLLRLRIRADLNPIVSPDSQLSYGQTEDFAVSILADVLPVTFGNLEANYSNSSLQVSWRTETEVNNDYFEVESSVDGIHFNTIGRVSSQAQDGNSDRAINYLFESDGAFWMGVSPMAVIALFIIMLLAAFKRRERFARILLLALTFIVLGNVSCSKKDIKAYPTNKNVWIRIAQIDKDGVKNYSKTIKVIFD